MDSISSYIIEVKVLHIASIVDTVVIDPNCPVDHDVALQTAKTVVSEGIQADINWGNFVNGKGKCYKDLSF